MIPTDNPTDNPTENPTIIPTTLIPTNAPSILPTAIPSVYPSLSPPAEPTSRPKTSNYISNEPTSEPSRHPSSDPSVYPSPIATLIPTINYYELFNVSTCMILDILLNSTIKQHNATNLENNINLQNDIVESLEYLSHLNAGIEYNQIAINLSKIWQYNDNISGNCELTSTDNDKDIAIGHGLNGLLYASWIRFKVKFVSLDKRDEWENKLDSIIDPLERLLSETKYFINSTISIYYCQVVFKDSTDGDDSSEQVSIPITIIFTIGVMTFFVIVAIFGCIDAKLCRHNEIFSINGIISSMTYTVDIVSGMYCLCQTKYCKISIESQDNHNRNQDLICLFICWFV